MKPEFSEEISQDDLAALLVQSTEEPPENPAPTAEEFWLPSLSSPQMETFFDETDNTLVVGGRYSGKGYACSYNLVKHCYDYFDALALVIVKSKRQGTAGGFFAKLLSETLPDFANNIKGFNFKGPFTSIEKDLLVSITNRYGGQSLIQLVSIHHEQDLVKKIKGVEASKVLIDEITVFESEELVAQLRGALKRRRHVPRKAQTLLATCNPDDPEHWVAKTWGLKILADGTLDAEATNSQNPRYRVIQIVKEDNPDPGVHDYYENLKDALKNRPTQYARDVDNKWVAMPEGDSIFADTFVRDHHVRGDLANEEYLQPVVGMPIHIGADPGDVNHSLTFLQEIPTKDKMVWIAFDEITYIGKKVDLRTLTKAMMAKMQWWCEQMDHNFSFTFVSDRSAYDRFRAPTGSTDLQEIVRHYNAMLPEFPRLKPLPRPIACPKMEGSVEFRTRTLMDLLTRDEIFISAKCPILIEALEKITPKKDSPFTPGTHSKYKHSLDSLTYPLLYYKTGGLVTRQFDTANPILKPRMTAIGN